MNTYLVPTTAAYCYEPYDHIYLVYANSSQEAYQKACEKLQGEYIPQELPKYESYPFKLYKPSDTNIFPFYSTKKYDILTEAFKNTKGAEYMSYFQVNWNNYTDELSQKAAKENWSNDTYPHNEILANYMVKTHNKLQSEKNIKIINNYAIFNTGLYTNDYEEIYAYQTGNTVKFYTEYELNKMDIHNLPPKANYFSNPELLIFDPKCHIDIQYKHILSENKNIERVPEEIRHAKNLLAIMIGSIEIMKMKVSMNYKLAVPQYFNDQIQLLLPLYLLGNETPDLALAVTKHGNTYQGHTCLTLDMAYNNARLIARPESNWLATANNISAAKDNSIKEN